MNMAWNLLFIYVFFIESLVTVLFFNSFCERKKSLPLTILAGALLFEVGALANIFVISDSWSNILITVAATVSTALLLFKIKPISAIFYSALLITISTFLENTTILIMSSIAELYIINYKSEIILLIFEGIVSKGLFLATVMPLLRYTPKDRNTPRIPPGFYAFPIISLLVSLLFWIMSLNQPLTFSNQILLGVISILLFLATMFVFFSFQTNAQKEKQLLLLQQEQDKIETDMTYYDILEQQNANLRAYAHDAKMHLSAIKNLNTDPEIEVYISKMIERLAEYSKVCHSGNHVLDVVIDKYVTECKINEITFDFDIKNNNLSHIESYDIVAILGNLLDNAVEAAKGSEKKLVSLETDFRNNFSVVIISNSCDTNPLPSGSELPKTTKRNKRLHGFGLKSVKKTVKNYNGDIAFEYDADKRLFIATVMV